jgi:hypothetical protein
MVSPARLVSWHLSFTIVVVHNKAGYCAVVNVSTWSVLVVPCPVQDPEFRGHHTIAYSIQLQGDSSMVGMMEQKWRVVPRSIRALDKRWASGTVARDGVQTPVQKVQTTLPATSASGQAVQTPIQSQRPINLLQRAGSVPRSSDRLFLITTITSLLAIPIVSYFYYYHRKEHMDSKRHRMLKEAQARYQAAQTG